MHSQATDLNVRSMAHDKRSNLLLCTGAEAVRRVNLHSLDAEVGFLEPRGSVKLQVCDMDHLDFLCVYERRLRNIHHRLAWFALAREAEAKAKEAHAHCEAADF
jgi:hypothetical protein